MRKALIGAALAAAMAPAAASAEPTWRLEQPAPPAGAQFKVPLGAPGDMEFYAPNRGLLAVEGNSVVPRGLLYYNGQTWSELSQVCGGVADTTRIVWAGPDEFWTITEPSRPRTGAGRSLCHFSGGAVVGSYSTSDQAADPYRQMDAGACNGPSDCWFAGVATTDATGDRVGGFHLHWDGTNLRSVYVPQGRAVSDIVYNAGSFYESMFEGASFGNNDPPLLADAEPGSARLIHKSAGDSFAADPFTFPTPAPTATPAPTVAPTGPSGPSGPSGPTGATSITQGGLDLLSIAAGPDALWAVGGGAGSGPDKPATGIVDRPPVAALLSGDTWYALNLNAARFQPQERFVDVTSAGPGTAWAALQAFSDRRSTNARARVARLSSDGTMQITSLPTSGAGRGAAARIVFTGPNEGWMVTTAGWLFHYTDGTPQPVDTDPAFAQPITFRPNEAAEQFIPDDPPVDDSLINAPPPNIIKQHVKKPKAKVKKLKPLLQHVKSHLNGLKLVIRFKLARPAKVGLVAKRKNKVVARTAVRKLKPGHHKLALKLNRKHYPTGLKFVTHEKGVSNTPPDDTVVTTR